MLTELKNTIAPSLPNATKEHEEQYVNQFNNILRLYFNTIDGFTGAIVSTNGGKDLSFPHISASDSTDQYATADNTPTVVNWNTLESGSGFSLEAPGKAICDESGIYKITYSAQLANTDNVVHDAVFWLRLNGTDVARSGTIFTLQARKSTGEPTFVAAYSEIVFTVSGGDEIELIWATDKAYSTTGPVNGVYIHADPSQTSPYTRPAIPSVIGSITFLSRR